jgi:hypothetical protein
MQFRLTYQGLVLAESNKGSLQAARAKHKQEIRKVFHRQLRRFWEISPYLSSWGKPFTTGVMPRPGSRIFGRPDDEHSIPHLAKKHALGGFNFVPLLTHGLEVGCHIDVLFLRDDRVGSVLRAGDIDNRLKTLLDGLSMPQSVAQLGPFEHPEDDESPFFCLLEDDSLVTKVTVETDTLLETVPEVRSNAARVIVTVRTAPFRVTGSNVGFA